MKECPCCKNVTDNFGNNKLCRPCHLLKSRTRFSRYGYGKRVLKVKHSVIKNRLENGRNCKRCKKELVGKQEYWCSRYCSKYGLKKEYNNRVRKLNYEKYIARKKVRNMVVKKGFLLPKYCSFCGKLSKLEAHHPNYAMPYFVYWICRDCHQELHQNFTELEGSETDGDR